MKLSLFAYFCRDYYTALAGEKDKRLKFTPEGVCCEEGWEVRRHIVVEEETIRFCVSIKNITKEARCLPDIKILKLNSPVFCRQFKDLAIFRLTRENGDIPGLFYPASLDENMRDALLSNTTASGDEPLSQQALSSTFTADPGMVVLGNRKLFIGFAGQRNHFGCIRLSTDKWRRRVVSLEAVAELDQVLLPPGATFFCHDLIVQSGDSLESLLDQHVARIQKIYGKRQAPVNAIYGTGDYFGSNIDAKIVRRNLGCIERHHLAVQVFLLDRGWQKACGNWEPDPTRFPEGMAAIADEIHGHGLEAGIAIAPFLIHPDSAVLRQTPSLIQRTSNGQPRIFHTGTGECYILDPCAASTPAYLSDLFSRLLGWGYRYCRVDLLQAVCRAGATCCDSSCTRAMIYSHGLKLIRDAIGEKTILHVSGGLYEASAGLADIVSSGTDCQSCPDCLDQERLTVDQVRIRQNVSRSFYGALWTVDPGPLRLSRRGIFLPDQPDADESNPPMLTDAEARSLLVNQYLSGGLVHISECIRHIPPERLQLLRLILPNYARRCAPVASAGEYLPACFSCTHEQGDERWQMVYLCNWNGQRSRYLTFRLQDLVGLPSTSLYGVYEIFQSRFFGTFRGDESINVMVAVNDVIALRVTPLVTKNKILVGSTFNLSGGAEISPAGELCLRCVGDGTLTLWYSNQG